MKFFMKKLFPAIFKSEMQLEVQVPYFRTAHSLEGEWEFKEKQLT